MIDDPLFEYKAYKYNDIFELYKKDHIGIEDNKWHFQYRLRRVNDLLEIRSIEELIAKAAILGIDEDDIDFSDVN